MLEDGLVPTPTTLADIIERLRSIDVECPPGDGVAVFNRVYLTVTQRIAELLSSVPGSPTWSDPAMIADLDVRFARLWLEAYDTVVAGDPAPAPWAPLFEARSGGRWPIQYALAGMNSHIEHDLPLAVVRTCEARGLETDDVWRDYEAVNDVLAEVEADIRRSFLTEVGRAADEHVGPVVHLVSAWKIDKARDVAWVTAETLWALRRTEFLRERFVAGLGATVGMGSRVLLTPTR
jgi:hypothetical protein